MRFALVLSLTIAILAVIFAFYNTESATVNFFGPEVTQPLSLVLLATLLIGLIVGLLAAVPSWMKARRTIKDQRKLISRLEKRVAENNVEAGQPVVTEPPPATVRPEDTPRTPRDA